MNAKMVTRVVIEMTYKEAEDLMYEITDLNIKSDDAALMQLVVQISEAL